MTVTIHNGDCRAVLKSMADESVHCVVTSPPYFGLRDYGVDGQIGLETTPDAFVAEMVGVFSEVRRVLKNDGVLWLNLGDSYAGSWGNYGGKNRGAGKQRAVVSGSRVPNEAWDARTKFLPPAARGFPGIKPKDLIGIPWRVAFALQEDGWVLRQEIVWSKPNPMPESVRDRCTKSHEQLFMFAKAKWSGPEAGRYSHISAQDARWLALFFDTEGNLCLRRESGKGTDYGAHAAQLVLANTNRPLLEEAARIIGDGSILERGGTNVPMFYWQMCGKKAADLLSVIYPHLIIKQRQARCLLHLEGRKEIRGGHKRLDDAEIAYRDNLWRAVKDLNHFGNPDISWVPEPKFGRWSDCERYFYDADAIKEPAIYAGLTGQDDSGFKNPANFAGKHAANPEIRGEKPDKQRGHSRRHAGVNDRWDAMEKKEQCSGLRNKRSVWEVATAPFSEAHFATFPPALIEPCIKAGCPSGGTVLDPFGGAGTTGLVADRLQRNAILIELNPEYAAMARRRIEADAGLFCEVAA